MIIHLGENLRRLRKTQGLTQAELAKRLCVSPQAISKWERGESYPDILMLPVLADLFHISVDALMRIEDIPAENKLRKDQTNAEILVREGKELLHILALIMQNRLVAELYDLICQDPRFLPFVNALDKSIEQ